jgi:hypothetical protein
MSVLTDPTIKTRVSDLLDNCRYSGWVKKQGGKHRNWRRRYLVLTNGCCYYFETERATQAKGCFSLMGYSVSKGEETDKHKFIVKLVPESVSERTYYIALAAKHELEAWIKFFMDEINDIRLQYNQDNCGIYSAISDEDSDEETEAQRNNDPAAVRKYIDEHLHELVSPSTKGPPVPERPLETFAERKPSRGPLPAIPPSPNSPNSPFGHSDIQLPQPPTVVGGNGHIDENATYLSVVGMSSGSGSTAPLPLPRRNVPSPKMSGPLVPPPREQVPTNDDYVEQELIDMSEDAYYVDKEIIEQQLQTKTYEMSREEAKQALAKRSTNGMFLLRTSKHAGTDLVITVWNEGECKHYKLFQDMEKGFSLTQGAHFENLIDLVNHYKKNYLPKSEFQLSGPYR